ncbi:type I DNA topoisomerase [bacterium]|nr:type I DNA topoisomerase [bacterium]
MNLVLVESPAKAKTIEKYLGKEYKVKATVGHIIDLPKNSLAVDVDHKYEPQFETIKGKGELIKKLKKEIPKEGKVYFAMDPDREGEAIAWHASQALKVKSPLRISFNEITKSAVKEALNSPRDIDTNLVDAQFARRVLDRLVGYKLSQLLWKKIWYGLSAGRVQSVALRLVVEREGEIEKFIPVEYWDIEAMLDKEGKVRFVAPLSKIGDKKAKISTEAEARKVESDVKGKSFAVMQVTEKDVKRHPFPPFTTSTLQQSANRVLGYTAKRTMGIAQSLYQAGHISYMRTDSTNLSGQAINQMRDYIEKNIGKEYLPEKPNFFKTRSKNAQEAHEAIRPTDFFLTPDLMAKKVDSSEARLYELIWRRTLSTQMADKLTKSISAQIQPEGTNYVFIASGEKILFDGFRKILKGDKEEESVAILQDLKEGDKLSLVELSLLQKYTKPKPRYTEASLVKMLESLGIGRPSTYATIISVIVDRGYVQKVEKQLQPTEIGRVVCGFLKNNFNRLVDYEYTAGVEDKLDGIADGKVKYVPFIDSEYKPLVDDLEKADKSVKKEDVVILGKSEEKCPECGGEMVVRLGKNGTFLSCARFPECKGLKSLSPAEVLDEAKYLLAGKCDKCGGNMILKTGKYGKFWGCEKYPECKNIQPLLLKEVCPECGKNLTEKKGRWGKTFIGCSGYPNCRYIKKISKKSKEDSEE